MNGSKCVDHSNTILVVGDSLMSCVTAEPPHYKPVSDQTYTADLKTNDGIYKLKVIEPVKYPGINDSGYLCDVTGALVVIDLTKRDSIQNIRIWFEKYFDYGFDNPIILVGNKPKSSSVVQIGEEDIQELIEKYDFEYLECDTKPDKKSVGEIFENLVELMKK